MPAICIDIGNTRMKWYAKLPNNQVVFFASANTEPIGWLADFHQVQQQWPNTNACTWAIAGVNPSRVQQFADWLQQRGDHFKVITSYLQIPLQVELPEPSKVGIDRLLSALAVKHRKPSDQAAIIVDAGTAVTVNAMSADGLFLGGAIAPGLRTMRVALQQQTAKLPLVSDAPAGSKELPGKSTQEAIYFGTQELFLGGVERLIHMTGKHFNAEYVVYFTGGDGLLLQQHLGHLRGAFDACLTVEGLRLAASSSG
jgi:type III pantothenate kinase